MTDDISYPIIEVTPEQRFLLQRVFFTDEHDTPNDCRLAPGAVEMAKIQELVELNLVWARGSDEKTGDLKFCLTELGIATLKREPTDTLSNLQ